MNDTPRPLNLGEIFDRTVNFYRSRFLLFFGIAAIPTGAVLVVASGVFLFLAWWGNNGAASAPRAVTGAIAIGFVAVAGLLALPVVLGATALANAAIQHAVNCAWLGTAVTIRAAYKAVLPRIGRYIWLYLLQALAIWGVPIAAWAGLMLLAIGAEALLGGAFANGGAASGALIGLMTLLSAAALFGYAVWMLLRLSLAFPASVVEQITAWAALKRSARLSKGTRGRIFLLYLLGTVLSYLMAFALVFVVAIAIVLLPGFANPQRQQTLGMIILFVYYGAGFAVQALTRPVFGIAFLLFYYDQRIRLEGYDIEWLMQRSGLVVPAQTAPGIPADASIPLRDVPDNTAPAAPTDATRQFSVPYDAPPAREEAHKEPV